MKRLYFICLTLCLWATPAAAQMFQQAVENAIKKSLDAETLFLRAVDYFAAKDTLKAVKYTAWSAEKGLMEAQYGLGLMYYEGVGMRPDKAEAAKWYLEAAKQGYAEAQCDLGTMLASGDGIKAKPKEAVKWFQKAAEQGNARAQYNLGYMYEHGQGIKSNWTEAKIWYKKSAEQGYAKAQHAMGEVCRISYSAKENAMAEQWYRKAVEQGYVPSQTGLGVLYEEGIGVKQNYQTALEWYRSAADKGDSDAMYHLGLMYRDGKGVKKDYAEAYKWWYMAAEYGETKSMFCIGLLYESGTGVSENIDEALKWYSQASALGYDLATNQIKLIKKSQRLQRIMQENMEYRAQKERERQQMLAQAERQREAYNRYVQQEMRAREEQRQMVANTFASTNSGGQNTIQYSNQNTNQYSNQAPSPTPTKPLATATDFPTSNITYQTDEPHAYQRMMYTVRINTYNGYQKAYVQVQKSTETLGKFSAFMIYADGTTVEDPSQYGLLGNNADYTIKLNKGGESIEVNGKTLYKATADTKVFNSAMTQQNLEILQEANNMKFDTSSSDKSSDSKHGTKWSKCSNSTCVNGYDKTVLSSAVPSTMAPPHHHPGGYNCGICGKDYAHWHQRCPSCLPNKGRELQRY